MQIRYLWRRVPPPPGTALFALGFFFYERGKVRIGRYLYPQSEALKTQESTGKTLKLP